MFYFDLQMFAEEEIAQDSGIDIAAEDGGEVSQEPEPAPAEEDKEPIPPELEGIDEHIAREVMEEAKAAEQEEEEQQPQQTDEEGFVKNQAIPYPRWQQKLAETNNLKQQLEAYRQKFGDLNGQGVQVTQATPQPQPQPNQAPVMQPKVAQPLPDIQFTPEIMQQIAEMTKQQAMQMTGMTQDDVDSIPFMEDGDKRKTQYQTALRMAEANVYSRIQQARQAEMARRNDMQRQYNASAELFNAYAQQESAEPDYNQIVAYATGDYFRNVSPADQPIIAEAYARIERNTATPQDTMLIRQFYAQAKAAYRRQHPLGKNATKKNPMSKVKAAQSFPRSSQLTGAGDNGSVSWESIDHMLDTMPYDKIPQNIRNMLENGSITPSE